MDIFTKIGRFYALKIINRTIDGIHPIISNVNVRPVDAQALAFVATARHVPLPLSFYRATSGVQSET